MDEGLHATANELHAAMPCSIEMPAGAGKTELVAALSAIAQERGQRVLILTHTNAGVDTLRARLARFGVERTSARVDTIASWSFRLSGHYPNLAGLQVGQLPDWRRSNEYYAGGAIAARAAAIRQVLAASYSFVVIDEYQDCVVEQHALAKALHEVLPVCVLGDPLQNIFTFGTNKTVHWTRDVTSLWPPHDLPVVPWRWRGHNEALGRWLLEIRPRLKAGEAVDLTGAPLTWVQTSDTAARNACLGKVKLDGSVVAIGEFAADCAQAASKLNGAFSMIEELQGHFMLAFASKVDKGGQTLAFDTLAFAKDCAIGVAEQLDAYVAKKLRENQRVDGLKRPGAELQLSAFSDLLTDPSPRGVRQALQTIEKLNGIRMYRREAWRDMVQALALASTSDDLSVEDAVTKVRNQVRYAGRMKLSRVVGRPLLIKGLEYDHAVVLDADRHKSTNLYVALSRARSSLTVVSKERVLRPDYVEL